MSSFPCEISDAETIIRGICSPYHVSSAGKLKPQAFDPTPGTEDVSVMRHDWIGSDACKQHSKKLEQPGKDKIYRGMAVLIAKQIRSVGADIVDSRELFEGHADIKCGYRTVSGDPPPAEVVHLKRQRSKQLASLARYFADPDPDSNLWNGPSLT